MVYETKSVLSQSNPIVSSISDKCSDMIYKARCIKSLNEAYIKPVLEYFEKQDVTLWNDPLQIAWSLLRQGGLLCTLLNLYRPSTIETSKITPIPTDRSLNEDDFINDSAQRNVRMFIDSCRDDVFFPSDELFDPKELYDERNMNTLNKALAFTEKFYVKLKRIKNIKFESLIAKIKEEEEAAMGPDSRARRESHSSDSQAADTGPITDKRLRAIDEILTSERSYVSDLDQLFKYSEEIRLDKVVPPDVISKIFGNFGELINFQQRYSYLVENTIKGNMLRDVQASYEGHIFKKLFIDQEQAFGVYMDYVANLPQARALIKENMTALMEKRAHMDPQGQLDSFLIKPTQRLCKYPLLIREVIRNSSPDAPDIDELKEAYAAADRNAARVNELLEQGDNHMEAARMVEQVDNWTIGRTRIDKDSLGKLLRFQKLMYVKGDSNENEVTLYLFETRFLMCRPGKTMLRNNPTLTLKWSTPVEYIQSFEDISHTEPGTNAMVYGFKLFVNAGNDVLVVTFHCRNAESVKLWLKCFKKLGMPSHDEATMDEPAVAATSKRASLFKRHIPVPSAAIIAGKSGGSTVSSVEEIQTQPQPQANERAPVNGSTGSYAQVKFCYGEEYYCVILPHVPTIEQFKRLAIKTLKADAERRGNAFDMDKEDMLLKYKDSDGDLINVLDDNCLGTACKYVTPGKLNLHILSK